MPSGWSLGASTWRAPSQEQRVLNARAHQTREQEERSIRELRHLERNLERQRGLERRVQRANNNALRSEIQSARVASAYNRGALSAATMGLGGGYAVGLDPLSSYGGGLGIRSAVVPPVGLLGARTGYATPGIGLGGGLGMGGLGVGGLGVPGAGLGLRRARSVGNMGMLAAQQNLAAERAAVQRATLNAQTAALGAQTAALNRRQRVLSQQSMMRQQAALQTAALQNQAARAQLQHANADYLSANALGASTAGLSGLDGDFGGMNLGIGTATAGGGLGIPGMGMGRRRANSFSGLGVGTAPVVNHNVFNLGSRSGIWNQQGYGDLLADDGFGSGGGGMADLGLDDDLLGGGMAGGGMAGGGAGSNVFVTDNNQTGDGRQIVRNLGAVQAVQQDMGDPDAAMESVMQRLAVVAGQRGANAVVNAALSQSGSRYIAKGMAVIVR